MAPPVAVVDALNSLLEAELNSVFRFMGSGSPYLSRATADVRRPLQEMVEESRRHSNELAQLIDYLGGVPVPRLGVQSEEQYLAFLSLKFLLPKLADAKKLMIQRYENALRAIGDRSPEIASVLHHHLEEHQSDLQILQKASADVIAAK